MFKRSKILTGKWSLTKIIDKRNRLNFFKKFNIPPSILLTTPEHYVVMYDDYMGGGAVNILPNRFKYINHYELDKEILKWCEKNIRGYVTFNGKIKDNNLYGLRSEKFAGVLIYFTDDVDYVNFKLRWC